MLPYSELINHTNVSTFHSYTSTLNKSSFDFAKDDKSYCILWESIYDLNETNDINITSLKDSEKYATEKQPCHQIFTKEATFKKGEQIYLNYGADTNDDLLLLYGFYIPFNIYDNYQVKIDKDKSSKLCILLSKYQNRITNISKGVLIYYQNLSIEFIQYAKFLVLDEPQFIESLKGPIIEYEIKGIQKCISILEEVCTAFPTSLMKDLDLISHGGLSYNLYLAISYRAWKKRIIHHQIFLLRTALELITAPNKMTKVLAEGSMCEFDIKLNRRMMREYLNWVSQSKAI